MPPNQANLTMQASGGAARLSRMYVAACSSVTCLKELESAEVKIPENIFHVKSEPVNICQRVYRNKADARHFDGTSPSLFLISHQSTESRKPASSPSQPFACDIPKNTSLPSFLPDKRKNGIIGYPSIELYIIYSFALDTNRMKRLFNNQSINQSIHPKRKVK